MRKTPFDSIMKTESSKKSLAPGATQLRGFAKEMGSLHYMNGFRQGTASAVP
jgi:hypothetical protein